MTTKIWIAAIFGVVLAGGVAVAQMPPAPPAGDAGPAQPGGEMGRHGMDGMHGSMAMEGHHPHPWMMHAMMMKRVEEASKAAHFRFRKGGAMVDIKCAADENMKACVDASTTLLDKLNAAPK